MEYQETGLGYVVHILRGEDIFDVLPRFCVEKGITAISLSGLGAVEGLTCGHYDLANKRFVMKEYEQLVELLNMSGNVALVNGKPTLHIHGVFSDDTNQAFGGHVTRMRAGITIEAHLVVHQKPIQKVQDEFSGLHLMKLEDSYA